MSTQKASIESIIKAFDTISNMSDRRRFLKRVFGLGAVAGATALSSNERAQAVGIDASLTNRNGKWIEVVLSQQRIYAWVSGSLFLTSLVSTGTASHPTLRGNFHVYVKYVATRMRGPGYNLPNVPCTMYFFRGYGLHGTYWHHNFGHPMSHGCVNLPTPVAAQLFAWTPVGTLVNVHY